MQLIIIIAVVVYKVTINTVLANTEPFLPGEVCLHISVKNNLKQLRSLVLIRIKH